MTTARTTAATEPAVGDLPREVNETPPGERAFGWTFWMLNSIEAFERLAYYGLRAVAPIYIMQATEPGGLHLTAVHKGLIYAWWAIFQSWLPMVTGGYADRFGYKRTLTFAITMNVVGYVLMAFLHSYAGFFAGVLVLATGTAFFKPALQGSLAQKLHKDNASMGWGIFYWVVNVGAYGAPLIATVILGKPHSAETWRNLFLASAGYTALNLLLLLTFRDVPSGADKTRGLGQVFAETLENIWPFWFRGGVLSTIRLVMGLVLLLAGIVLFFVEPIAALGGWQATFATGLCVIGALLPLWLKGGVFTWQLRLPAFILIMSCFWMMMYQLWDLHPNFVEDWVDSADIARYVPFDWWWEYGDRGIIRVPQQILLSLNALLIILLVMPISWLVRRMRTLSAMLIGMFVATIGILVAGLTGNGWILLLGVVFFSLGEMLTGPKKNQYLGLIAPPGKKGLYLGYVNIPIGLGVGLGSILAGVIYDNYGEKASLALKELGADAQVAARATRSIDWSDSLQLVPELTGLPRSEALLQAAGQMGQPEAEAAAELRAAFRWDEGQLVNLALIYLAQTPAEESPDEAFLKRLHEAAAKLDAEKRPAAAALRSALDAQAPRATLPVAPLVDILPKALDRKRSEAFDIACDRMNQGRPDDARLSDGMVAARLWEIYGDDPQVVNNLALEYLAQNTDLVAERVAAMTFDKPVDELPEKAGIDRTKSFVALSCARGASDAEVLMALAALDMDTAAPDARPYVYLAESAHRRFNAVGRRDWSREIPFLRELIESDPAALKVVRTKLPPDPAAKPEDVDRTTYAKLADDHSLIQEALAVKNWRSVPQQAGHLLELNPYEARSLVAADLDNALLTTTHLLWEKYEPQYKVWIPFAAIGVIATIALGIFGQMAKRWADMNA